MDLRRIKKSKKSRGSRKEAEPATSTGQAAGRAPDGTDPAPSTAVDERGSPPAPGGPTGPVPADPATATPAAPVALAEPDGPADDAAAADAVRAERAEAVARAAVERAETVYRDAAERAEIAEVMYRAALRRGEIADEREHAATERVSAIEARETAAAERDAAIGAREKAAAERDAIANTRDRTAVERDSIANTRDRTSAERESTLIVRLTAARPGGTEASDDAALERARLEAELQRAHLDALTGVFRREMGRLALRNEIERARRADGKFVIAFIDVDGLKGVNDREGHAAGDRILRTLAATMRANLRSYDPIVRFGGDEFICGISSIDTGEVQHRIGVIDQSLRNATGVGITAGLAEMTSNESLDELTAKADAALIEAKRHRDD